ncbi:Uncharacterised protein g10433 [Pycnogonum litorale]
MVVAKTPDSLNTDCNSEEFIRDDDESLRSIQVAITKDGTLVEHQTRLETERPGKFIYLGNKVFSSEEMFVLDTDYRNYALMLKCQPYFFFSTATVKLLSRRPKFEDHQIDGIQEAINHELTKVDQTNCIIRSMPTGWTTVDPS